MIEKENSIESVLTDWDGTKEALRMCLNYDLIDMAVECWPLTSSPPPRYLNLLWLEPGETRFEIECDNLIWMIRLNIELFIDYWLGDL